MNNNNLHIRFMNPDENRSKFRRMVNKAGFKGDRSMLFPFRLGCFFLPTGFTKDEIHKYVVNRDEFFLEDDVWKFVSTDFSQYECVYLWCDSSLNSRMMVYLMCSMYQGMMSIVDCSNGAVIPINEYMHTEYAVKWEKLVKEDTGLRINTVAGVMTVPADSFDEILIKNGKQNAKYNRGFQPSLSFCFIDKNYLPEMDSIASKYFLDSDSYYFQYMYRRLLVLASQGKFQLRQREDFNEKDISGDVPTDSDFIQGVDIRAGIYVEAKYIGNSSGNDM